MPNLAGSSSWLLRPVAPGGGLPAGRALREEGDLALSGAGWLLVAYDLTPLLALKIALFACVFVLGPIIDHVAEPGFKRHAPSDGQAASPEFMRASGRYVALEIAATGLFYLIITLWVLLA